MHKAHWENLPSPLGASIICGRASIHPSRTPDSVVLPPFNSRFAQLSIRYRGAVLWNNTLANDRSIVDASCTSLPTKLKDCRFLNFNFHATSISTTDLSDYDDNDKNNLMIIIIIIMMMMMMMMIIIIKSIQYTSKVIENGVLFKNQN